MGSRMNAMRPMRSLLMRLPQLPTAPGLEIDFAAADSQLLMDLLEDAQTTVDVIHLGVGAIGHLLANSAMMVEDGTIGSDCLEAIGFLLAELGDMAIGCMSLAAHCRREVAENKPSQLVKAAQAAGKTKPGCVACASATAHGSIGGASSNAAKHAAHMPTEAP